MCPLLPREERASAFFMPNGWGEGGMNQPLFWAVALFYFEPQELGAVHKRTILS